MHEKFVKIFSDAPTIRILKESFYMLLLSCLPEHHGSLMMPCWHASICCELKPSPASSQKGIVVFLMEKKWDDEEKEIYPREIAKVFQFSKYIQKLCGLFRNLSAVLFPIKWFKTFSSLSRLRDVFVLSCCDIGFLELQQSNEIKENSKTNAANIYQK